MSCEMISSRKIDYYVNDPYVTIIDIRLKEKYVYSRIKGAIHYEYNKLVDDINNIYKCGKISYEFRKIFGNKEKIYIFYLILYFILSSIYFSSSSVSYSLFCS